MNLNIRFIDMGCMIILVVFLAAGTVFVRNNFSTHQIKMNLAQEEMDQNKNQLKMESAKLEQLRIQFKKQENQLLELNERIPNEPMIGDLLTKLYACVKTRKLSLIDFNYSPPQAFEKYSRIPIQIVVTGDFLSIYGLIHDLESLNRVFVFEQISLDREDRQDLCRAILLASVFQQ